MMTGSLPELSLKDLKEFVLFAKKEGLPSLEVGSFKCVIPPKDATQVELAAIYKRILALESICQRLSLQLDGQLATRNSMKPFSARIDLQKKGGS